MNHLSSPFPSPKEGLRLHLRLCDLDPVAPADTCRAYVEPLAGWLTSVSPRVDPHLCQTAVHDTLVTYFNRPQAYDPAAAQRLEPILRRLRDDGLPNFHGPQRFGRDGETVRLGLSLLRGEPVPRAPRSPFLRKLALSAAQSALFNHCLARRLADGLMRRVLPGDVMAKWPFGGLFVAQDVAREQSRFDRRETVHAGPMFGRKTFAAAGEAAAREEVTLADAGLTRASFHGFGKLMQGTRRHNLVYPDGLRAMAEPEGVRLTFTLPAGSYATVLLHEVMKAEVAGGDDE